MNTSPPPNLLQRLQARGLRLTGQRRALARVLDGPNVHLTADEVFERARLELPDISRATVYNNLKELVALGELLELSLDGRVRHYDPNVEPAHHHLVCDGCNRIVDVLAGVHTPEVPEAGQLGFDVTDGHLVYRGMCGSCRG